MDKATHSHLVITGTYVVTAWDSGLCLNMGEGVSLWTIVF